MSSFAVKCAACVAALLLLAALDLGYAEEKHFPQLAGQSLNQLEVNLPRDLPADIAIIVLTFSQQQQGKADDWIQGLLRLNPNCPYIEVAVIGPVNAFVKGMIVSGMRRGIVDRSRRDRFIAAFVPAADLARALGCPQDIQEVCVAAVGRSGEIFQVRSGDRSNAAAESLPDQVHRNMTR